uniref:Uncharacterized protein n=1 Tax=Clytia hemisphaerica TaxID=252671 RepID=A0A7M5UKF5_9CNID|eukprot:TCONS_00046338-protein
MHNIDKMEVDSNNSKKTTSATRKRHAIRLFIGYEQDAQELVKKFIDMKRQHDFQSTVDLFSWLLELGHSAEKPFRPAKIRRLAKECDNKNTRPGPHKHEQQLDPENEASKSGNVRRRKQQNPLKANRTSSEEHEEYSPTQMDEYELKSDSPVYPRRREFDSKTIDYGHIVSSIERRRSEHNQGFSDGKRSEMNPDLHGTTKKYDTHPDGKRYVFNQDITGERYQYHSTVAVGKRFEYPGCIVVKEESFDEELSSCDGSETSYHGP